MNYGKGLIATLTSHSKGLGVAEQMGINVELDADLVQVFCDKGIKLPASFLEKNNRENKHQIFKGLQTTQE